jgi:hypothetical protein
MVSLLVFMI